MKRLLAQLLATLIGCSILPASAAPPGPYEEVPIGYLGSDSVNATLKKTLSPQGRYLILPARSTVRIYDSKDKIEAARRALDQLQNAPAIVSVEISVKTGLRRVTTQQYPSEQPVRSSEVPIPRYQGPTRIVVNPGGSVTVVPGQPRDFTTRRVEPGTVVNPGVTGYATLDSEVRMNESALKGGVTRKFSGSAPFAKPISLPVSAKAAVPSALRDWALRHGAIPAGEPAWAGAGTELLVTPEMSKDGLLMHVVPQIIVAAGDKHQPVRRIPLSSCATSVFIERGKSTAIEGLPGADAEFYQVFFGAAEAREETQTSLSVAAAMEYVGR